MKNRLDKELVLRKLAPSRSKSQELINAGFVVCDGNVIDKCNYSVDETVEISILKNDRLKYVSRAGLKLEKALNEFDIDVSGLNVMDIGSSTGGFTDCSLKHGARHVIAIDVGTNVMESSLRCDDRIDLHENTDFRNLEHKYFKDIDLIVCDVSFISLKKIIDKICDEKITIDLICLIKPQFECGREIASKYKGIILNKEIHKNIINDLIDYFNNKKLFLKNISYSPIKGGDGNIEYLVYLSNKIDFNCNYDIDSLVKIAFKKK